MPFTTATSYAIPARAPGGAGGAGGGGGGIAPIAWPCASRTLTASDISTTGGPFRMRFRGGWVVALGDFSGYYISNNGRDWYPLGNGSRWPHPGGKSSFYLKRKTAGGGELVLAQYVGESAEGDAAALAGALGAGGTSSGGAVVPSGSNPATQLSGNGTFTPAAGTLYTIVKAGQENTGGPSSSFIGDTAAAALVATTRFPLDQGDFETVYGSFGYSITAGDFFYTWEHKA